MNIIKTNAETKEQEVITSRQASYEIWYRWHNGWDQVYNPMCGISYESWTMMPDEIEHGLEHGIEFSTFNATYSGEFFKTYDYKLA